ncbi:MAG: hypothetical protein JEZ08_01660 [Clostridiales bacterium]|nr:hypothetical protein [Clostridiales bacterium]
MIEVDGDTKITVSHMPFNTGKIRMLLCLVACVPVSVLEYKRRLNSFYELEHMTIE